MENADDVILEYVNGASVPQLAMKYKVPPMRIYSILYERKIPRRSQGASRRLTAKAERSKYSAEIVERFLAGESVKALAVATGRERSHIVRCLADHGITPRNRSEGMYARMASTTLEERKRLVAKANERMRALPREFHQASSEKQAVCKQATGAKIGAGEAEMLYWLHERGYEGISQLACGAYNIDIAVGSLAVEIHISAVQPHNTPMYRKRIEYLLSRGYDVLYVKVSKQRPLDSIAADHVVAFLEYRRWHPTAPREYRMIRGDGEYAATYRLDGEDGSLIPVPGHSLYAP